MPVANKIRKTIARDNILTREEEKT